MWRPDGVTHRARLAGRGDRSSRPVSGHLTHRFSGVFALADQVAHAGAILDSQPAGRARASASPLAAVRPEWPLSRRELPAMLMVSRTGAFRGLARSGPAGPATAAKARTLIGRCVPLRSPAATASTRAEPTTTASATRATSAARSGVLTPKPTATGRPKPGAHPRHGRRHSAASASSGPGHPGDRDVVDEARGPAGDDRHAARRPVVGVGQADQARRLRRPGRRPAGRLPRAGSRPRSRRRPRPRRRRAAKASKPQLTRIGFEVAHQDDRRGRRRSRGSFGQAQHVV